MISLAAGVAIGATSAAAIRYSRYEMSDIQDAAPSSTEPQIPLGEPVGVVSAPAVTESSGTTASTTDMPPTSATSTQTSQPSNDQAAIPSTTGVDGTAGDAGNEAGQADSAATATSTIDAPLAPVTALAVATFADLMDQFETRQYPDGSTLKAAGELPAESPVSYPAPQAPEVDTPQGLLNAIEEYFTTALRSSRTDGHKLIAQLRAQLPL